MGNSHQPLRNIIPEVYAPLLPDFFDSPFPREVLADCAHCPMCPEDDDPSHPAGFANKFSAYHSGVKCCSFFPDLPNFLAGSILAAPGLEEGGKRLKELIRRGEGANPLAVCPPEEYSRAYQQKSDYVFGLDHDLLCPYYNEAENNCSIWPFRQAVCVTYICKSVEGIAGRIFWDRMNSYLCLAETKLAVHALQQLGLAPETGMGYAFGEAGTEARMDLYMRCRDIITGLSRREFAEMADAPDLAESLRRLREAYALAARTTPPDTLRINPELRFSELPGNRYRYDTGRGSCVLSSRVHAVLAYFDGNQANSRTCEKVLHDLNIRLSPDFLLKLFKNGILLKAEPSPNNELDNTQRL